jgi:hypothetical protein
MDEMLLNELYGDDYNGQDYESDELTKLAQVELVEAVAAENGIDLEMLDDDELEKFASYVLDGDAEDSEFYEDDYEDDYENDYGYDEYDFQEKLAEADTMGRIMARAYVDEQLQIEDELYDDFDDFDEEYSQIKVASALMDIENAWALDQYDADDAELIGYEAFEKRAEYLLDLDEPGLAYIESLDEEDFAKEAELRACEMLIEEGIDPLTLEYIEPDYVKLASFPDLSEAYSDVAALAISKYNDDLDYAALHIINSIFDNYDYL